MPISNTLKTIFVHIPKNAGESIEKSLNIYPTDKDICFKNYWGTKNNREVLQHYTAQKIKDSINNDMWESYFKFAVVRDPWSRAVSEYNWYLQFGPTITFQEWVESLPHRLNINSAIHILEVGHNIEQYKYICDKKGNILVDHIIKFDNLKEEFNKLCQRKSWDIELIHTNKSKANKKVDWRSYYDEKSLELISKIYKTDIEMFDYDSTIIFKNFEVREEPAPLDIFFDGDLYLELHKDVSKSNIKAFDHYLQIGIKEGRSISKPDYSERNRQHDEIESKEEIKSQEEIKSTKNFNKFFQVIKNILKKFLYKS